MRIRRVKAALAATSIVAATLVAQAPTAQAAVIDRPLDLETIADDGRPSIGWALTKGTLAWHDRTKVVATGWIDDRCPADGYGAYLYVEAVYMNGGGDNRGLVAKDTRTCNAAAGLPVGFPSPVVFDSTRWIRYLRFCLIEVDRDRPPQWQQGEKDCDNFDNPHT